MTSQKEKNREYCKEWREKNKEKFAEYQKKWREKNKEKTKDYQKKWREENKEKWNKIVRDSRNRKKLESYTQAINNISENILKINKIKNIKLISERTNEDPLKNHVLIIDYNNGKKEHIRELRNIGKFTKKLLKNE